MTPITQLTIHGFKSIQNLNEFELGNLNVLIGANGSGKSNFISWFEMMKELAEHRLRFWISNRKNVDRILWEGSKKIKSLESKITCGPLTYSFTLEPNDQWGMVFTDEKINIPIGFTHEPPFYPESFVIERDFDEKLPDEWQFIQIIDNWQIYHFHDTTPTSGMVLEQDLQDDKYLRPNAENIAPILFRIRREVPETYQRIRKIVNLAAPFFEDFFLNPRKSDSGKEIVDLSWTQTDCEDPFNPTQLSDGTLRFICLVTALLQPNPPSTILIDEPELGLHPYALAILGDLLRTASQRMQIIVSTQSVSLVNEFSIDDLIVVERQNGASTFQRLKEEDFQAWLEDYSTGELWEKNILRGRLPQ